MSKPYKILSLDGGGSWAILEAMALQKLFPTKSNKEILSEFDLVATNSGGSLVLSAMLEYKTMQQVIELFKNQKTRESIFYRMPFYKRIAWGISPVGPKYFTSEKIKGLERALPNYGNKNLSDIPKELGLETKFLIMSFDYDRQRSVYFRSDLNSPSSSGSGNTVSLANAVHASSNAPVNYFNKPAEFTYGSRKRRYWDGAVAGNNNPCLVATVEALAYGIKRECIRILSIGTGNSLLPIQGINSVATRIPDLIQPKDKQGLFKDILKMTKSILQEPPDAAAYMTHLTLGGKVIDDVRTNIIRLNPLIQPLWKDNEWMLPEGLTIEKFMDLVELEMDAVDQTEVDLIEEFGKLWLLDKVPNQTLRYNSNFEKQIGHEWFSLGESDWKRIKEMPC